MSNHSFLTIGNVQLETPDIVPKNLCCLFRESDLVLESHTVIEEDGEQWEAWDHASLTSTCGQMAATLDSYGYTIEVFAEIFDQYYDMLNSEVRILADNQLVKAGIASITKRNRTVEKYLSSSRAQTRADELRAFIAFIRNHRISNFTKFELPYENDLSGFMNTSRGIEYFEKFRHTPAAYYIRSGIFAEETLANRDIYATDVSYYYLLLYLSQHIMSIPARVARTLKLISFGEAYQYCPDLLEFMYVRLFVDAASRNAPICLDMTRGFDEWLDEDIASIKEWCNKGPIDLVQKSLVYARVSKALSEEKADVKDRVVKLQSRATLGQLRTASTNDEKGKLLENLMSTIFSGYPGLSVAQERYSTEDEEIDLIIKNNINQPFWINLHSPALFVECKNWSTPVEANEVTIFMGKLRHHVALTRVGFFVAASGYTRGCTTQVHRESLSGQLLVLLDLNDLFDFVNGPQTVAEWLEARILAPI
jgi:hypothetical protein